MNRLKIRSWLCLLSFIVSIVSFQGCVTSSSGPAQYSFIEPVQVVEVDEDTKSFRIVLEWLEGDRDPSCPYLKIDTTKTTARHKTHFINHVELPFMTIGIFTQMDSDRMFYRDVVVIPENVTEDVSIFYDIVNVRIELNDRLEVILRPKNR